MKIFMLMLLCGPTLVLSSRRYVSLEESIAQSSLIFEGTVVDFKNVPAPHRESYFTHDAEALELKVRISKTWKGTLQGDVKVYTWALGKAPCSGIELKKAEAYLIYAEPNPAKKVLTFDFCNGLRPLKAPYVQSDLRILNQLYPASH